MVKSPTDISILIGGEAGLGVFLSGRLLAKAFARGGLHVFGTNEYPSVIRGGHQWYRLRVSSSEVHSQRYNLDLLIALDRDTIEKHLEELRGGGGIVADVRDVEGVEDAKGYRIFSLPLADIVKRLGGLKVMRNTVALGAAVALLNWDLSFLLGSIASTIGKRDLAETNMMLAREGFELVADKFGRGAFMDVKAPRTRSLIFISGNEAMGIGALAAGLKFFAAYPMTPASPLLHFLASVQDTCEIVAIQPESEIAAINMVVGAAYAGVRSMTATSGGGFSLMVETLGLAAMAEIPIVVVVAQRPGPSTGMPTFTSQGDLRFVLHASQGEFPRVVLAPGDVHEAFRAVVDGLNIAWKFQVPVIILSDKYLSESSKTVEGFDVDNVEVAWGELIRGRYEGEKPYKRYRITGTGTSPMAIPGTKGAIVKANSTEHDESGFVTIDSKMVKSMVDKRFRKARFIEKEMYRSNPVKVYGNEHSDVTVVSWGSTKGPILEALKQLPGVRFLQVLWISPFPSKTLSRYIVDPERTVVVENNKTGLLRGLIREKLLLDIPNILTKYDGRPFYPHEIVDYLGGFIRG